MTRVFVFVCVVLISVVVAVVIVDVVFDCLVLHKFAVKAKRI